MCATTMAVVKSYIDFLHQELKKATSPGEMEQILEEINTAYLRLLELERE